MYKNVLILTHLLGGLYLSKLLRIQFVYEKRAVRPALQLLKFFILYNLAAYHSRCSNCRPDF